MPWVGAFLFNPCAVLILPQIHDIVEGLIYLHQLDIVHGDLKGVRTLI